MLLLLLHGVDYFDTNDRRRIFWSFDKAQGGGFEIHAHTRASPPRKHYHKTTISKSRHQARFKVL